MRDPIEELENFTTPGLTMDPLPVTEVRRRGTRMRRRNNALAAMGGALVVAIIAAPLALVARHETSSTPPVPPAGQPSAGWRQTIPADFDLTALPAGATFTFTASDRSSIDGARPCGRETFPILSPNPAGPVVDAAGAIHGEPRTESSAARTLALYQDEQQAEAALQKLEEGVLACPEDTREGVRFVNDPVESTLPADDSFVYSEQVQQSGLISDLTLYQVARVGNALYLASEHTSAGGAQVVADQARRMADLSAPVLDQMCVFSVDGCTGSSPAADDMATEGIGEGAVPAIPADFPLLDGLPTDANGGPAFGREGPSATIAPLTVQACGQTLAGLPEPVETVRGGWRDPAETRQRQLMTFARTDDAQGYAAGVVQFLGGCLEDASGGRVVKRTVVMEEPIGDYTGAAVTFFEADGQPGPGVQVTEVVRVGRAVLLVQVIDEGHEPVTDPQTTDVAYQHLDQAAGVVDAMCLFTETGC